MIAFDAAHRAVHYPEERRFRIWIKPAILWGIVIAVIIPFAIAWLQYTLFGLPHIAPVLQYNPPSPTAPHGFPLAIRYTHFFNFLFLTMLIRSGISILMDHPRLYFNDHCTPGSEWFRFTPLKVPKDRFWTAKDDAGDIPSRWNCDFCHMQRISQEYAVIGIDHYEKCSCKEWCTGSISR